MIYSAHLVLSFAIGFGLAFILCIFFLFFKKDRSAKLSLKKRTLDDSSINGKETQPILKDPYRFGGLSTRSHRVKEILKAVRIISGTSSTVLVEGESGTGKEMVARVLHDRGGRSNQPFIAVHAAALPENLLETELFGHEKGAFTGAISKRRGRFELAHKGTIFLDEVGELSPLLQVKLLRVIQERSFERVGGSEKVNVDVRIIVATNQSLSELVRQKKFREDLFYRMNVVSLRLIPLRERKEDLPVLIDELIGKHSRRVGKKINGYTPSFLEKLKVYNFPGNIRELENIIERAVVFCTNSFLDVPMLRFIDQTTELSGEPNDKENYLSFFQKKIDREKIVEAYYRAQGNKAMAARFLGMRESTYRYHLKKAFELRVPGSEVKGQ